MELIKKDKNYIGLVLSSIRTDNSLSRLSQNNRVSLKEMIKYLSNLSKHNLIDDKQFRELVSLTCANYIENEVEIRLDNAIGNKFINIFDKI